MKIKAFDLTDEEWNKLFLENYNWYKSDKNNYSYWYERVKECGINIAESYIYQIPFEQYLNSHSDDRNKIKKFEEYIEETIKELPYGIYNIKNATFSNKFDFRSCIAYKNDIPEKIGLINYASALVDAGGYTELVVREIIDYDKDIIPTIYNGMPLRGEYRVFYDFDEKKVLYSVNYWDYDYCYSHLNLTDKIIFEHERKRLEENFIYGKDEVEKLVSDHMKDIDLTGKWSIDILYNELEDNYWLIDMAEAHRSAYWKESEDKDENN